MQYCSTCGAANESERTNCFACSQPLNASINDNADQPEKNLRQGRYQLPPQQIMQQSRRRFLRGSVAGAVVLAGVLGIGEFIKHYIESNLNHPGPHREPTNTPQDQIQPLFVRTQNPQEKIISLNLENNVFAFASADNTGTITVWDSALRAIYTVALGTLVRALTWVPYQPYFLVATDHEIYLLQYKNLLAHKKIASHQERVVTAPATQAPYIYIAVRPGEDYFQVTDSNGVTTFFQQHSPAAIDHWVPFKQVARPTALKTLQDISYYPWDNALVAHDDNNIIVWDNNTDKIYATLPIDPANGRVTALSWSQAGSVIIGRSSGIVQFWDYITNDVTIGGHTSASVAITALAWDYRYQRYAFAAGQNVIVAEQQTPDDHYANLRLSFPHAQRAIESIAVTPLTLASSTKGTIYAAVTGEKFVQFWRPQPPEYPQD